MNRSLSPRSLLAATLIAGLALGAATPAKADKEDLGMIVGAGLGGLLGNQFGGGVGNSVATGLGVFIGGLGGRSIGQSLDRGDRAYYSGGSYNNIVWHDDRDYGRRWRQHRPHGYAHGYYDRPYRPTERQVVVVRETQPVYVQQGYASARTNDRYCREYQNSVRVGSRLQESYGTACLQPDGSWQVVQ